MMQRLTNRSLSNLIMALESVIQQGGTLRSGAGPVGGHRNGYIAWIRQAESALAFYFDRRDVESFLLTVRYWEIRRLEPVHDELVALISQEAEARITELDDVLTFYKALADRYSKEAGPVLVPDTNVFLHYTFFTEAPWCDLADGKAARIVVPIVVIEQLDRLKYSENSKRAERAQKVTRELARLSEPWPKEPAIIPNRGTIEVILDEPGHMRMAEEDAEIIEVVRGLSSLLSKPARIVTGDLGMTLRARALDVDVVAPPSDWQLLHQNKHKTVGN